MYDWLQRVWYGGAKSGLVLLPLAWLFALLVSLRRFLYGAGILRTQSVGVPVVVVGNLTAGGTGKTPLTLWLTTRLRECGLRPGVVLRGYGRSAGAGDAVRLVDSTSSAGEAGDEALLLARRCGCPVAIGKDRVAAARLLRAQGVDVIVADDGLQHLRLARVVEIVVVDAARGLGNGRLLPAGPLREPANRLRGVDAIVFNGSASDSRDLPHELGTEVLLGYRFEMSLEAQPAMALRGDRSRPLTEFRSQRVHAVAGIGNPARFFALLRAHGIDPIEHAMPDHAVPRREELEFGDGLEVLMTEKDAVKCTGRAGDRHWYVPVEAKLAPEGGSALVDLVVGKVRTRRARA